MTASEMKAEAIAKMREIIALLAPDTSQGAAERKAAEQRFRNPRADLLGCFYRLLWLLDLSPAERDFVQQAADANQSGHLPLADEHLSIFADWLEDEGRTENSKQIRRLLLENGDVLVLQMAGNTGEELEAARTMCGAIRKDLLNIGKDVNFVVLAPGQDLQTHGEAALRDAGYVRKEYASMQWSGLADELKGEPEEEPGTVASHQLVAMIRRLKAENKNLHKEARPAEATTLLAPDTGVLRLPLASDNNGRWYAVRNRRATSCFVHNEDGRVVCEVEARSVVTLLSHNGRWVMQHEEIERLKADNKRLRWHLNHQTEDDAEACRQGKHPPDCGA